MAIKGFHSINLDKPNDSITPIIAAIQHGFLNRVKKLIRDGADPSLGHISPLVFASSTLPPIPGTTVRRCLYMNLGGFVEYMCPGDVHFARRMQCAQYIAHALSENGPMWTPENHRDRRHSSHKLLTHIGSMMLSWDMCHEVETRDSGHDPDRDPSHDPSLVPSLDPSVFSDFPLETMYDLFVVLKLVD